MPCQILNCLRINARIEQIRDVSMPQQVRCYIEIQGIANLGIVPLRCSAAVWKFNIAISIYVISTFNTDYALVDRDDFEKAIDALRNTGYTIADDDKR